MFSITSKLSPVSPIIGKENTDLTFFLLSLGAQGWRDAGGCSSSKASIGLPVNASKGNRGPTQQHRAAPAPRSRR